MGRLSPTSGNQAVPGLDCIVLRPTVANAEHPWQTIQSGNVTHPVFKSSIQHPTTSKSGFPKQIPDLQLVPGRGLLMAGYRLHMNWAPALPSPPPCNRHAPHLRANNPPLADIVHSASCSDCTCVVFRRSQGLQGLDPPKSKLGHAEEEHPNQVLSSQVKGFMV